MRREKTQAFKKEAIEMFRDKCLLPDDLVWDVLNFAGIAGTGVFSMYFWVYI